MALRAFSIIEVSNIIDEFKELLDSNFRGSGFSFTEMLIFLLVEEVKSHC